MEKKADPKSPPGSLSGGMTIYAGKPLKCQKTDRIYVVVDALMGHKPIKLLSGQVSGNVKGVVLQTIIHPSDLANFIELPKEVPQPKIAKA